MPLYRRVITMAVCVVWLVVELIGQQSFWLMMAGAVNCYALWDFFLSPTYRDSAKPVPPDQDS